MSKELPNKFEDSGPSFGEFAQLAAKFKTVDFALGSPELDPPEFLKKNLIEALDKGPQQYIDPRGYGPLREAVAEHYAPHYEELKRDLDPDTEILATAGAVAGLYCGIMSIVSPGDEVAAFEPCWPGVINMVKAAGGKIVGIPLKMVETEQFWEYDWEAFEKVLNENTKAIIMTNPHSPSGLVFTEEEIQTMSEIIDKKAPGAYVLCDDVYDFCKFEKEKQNLFFASKNDNFNRTVTFMNGGKRFACTGWKVAWCIGPKHLIKRIGQYHATCVWNFNTPGQYAFAKSLAKDANEPYNGFDNYYDYIHDTYQKVNKGIAEVLEQSELPVRSSVAQGGFSMTVDISKCKDLIPAKYFTNEYLDDPKIATTHFEDEVPLDFAFCRWMACEKGIAMIPGSLCYIEKDNTRYDFVRISICKNVSIVEELKNKLTS